MPLEMWSTWLIDSPGPAGACLSIEPVFRCQESRCERELVIAVTHNKSCPESALLSKEASIHGLEYGYSAFDSRVRISPEEGAFSERAYDVKEESEEEMSNARTSGTRRRRTGRGGEIDA